MLAVLAPIVPPQALRAQGNVWDRHYGCRVGKLAHDACVNAVAFHPVTEAVAATASDDFTIKLWRSAESIPVMMNNLVE